MSELRRQSLRLNRPQVLKVGFGRGGLTLGRTAQQAGLWHFPHHIWQARFYDFNLWTERKRIEKLRYMHRNPVQRGLVESPAQWRWSSFRWYLCGEAGPVRINDTDILQMRVRAWAAFTPAPAGIACGAGKDIFPARDPGHPSESRITKLLHLLLLQLWHARRRLLLPCTR